MLPRLGSRPSDPFWSQPMKSVPSGAALMKTGYDTSGGAAKTVAENSSGNVTFWRICSAVSGTEAEGGVAAGRTEIEKRASRLETAGRQRMRERLGIVERKSEDDDAQRWTGPYPETGCPSDPSFPQAQSTPRVMRSR